MANKLNKTAEEVQSILPLFFKHLFRADQNKIETGLSRIHYETLEALEIAESDNEIISLSVLAKRLLISKAYISSLTDRLYKEKLIRRIADKNDRRITKVIITDAGKEILSEYKNNSLELMKLRLSTLNGNDIDNLHTSLKILKDIIIKIEI